MKLGFVGLGNIGRPMAACLASSGFELAVHDLHESRAEPLLELGARWCKTPAEAASGAQAVITSLPGPAEVGQVFDGPSGLRGALQHGQTWIEMSTNDPETVKQIAGGLRPAGVRTLEATVTCGVALAKQGKATVIVGGEEDLFDSYRPVFDALADKVVYVGDLGCSTIVKLITNMLAFAHESVLAEGLVLGTKAGVDSQRLLNGIQASYAASFVAEVDGPRALAGTYDSEFSLALALKDMHLTRALAERLGIALPFGELASETLAKAAERFGADADTLFAIKLTEERNGVSLKSV